MPVKIKKGYANLAWGQLHFRTVEDADGRPPLLLLHQTPLSSRNYEQLLPFLSEKCSPYALDTPGYGESSGVSESWEVRDYANVVWDFADNLGVEKVVLFGRATGAVFALEAALCHPSRVHCLILHGMPVYTDEERLDRSASYAPQFTLATDGSHLQLIWNRIKGEYPWIEPDMATIFARDFLRAGLDFARSYRAIWRYDLRKRLQHELRVPTLLVGGGADRIAFMHSRAVALMPYAESIYLDKATDFVAEQDPALFSKHLNAFIESYV